MNSEFRIQNPEPVGRRTAQSFRDLIVWQRAHEFVLVAYQYSETFPRSEVYGLSSQLRRAAISIAANIAEGFKKRGRNDKVRFLNIAQGSVEECRYYLLLTQDLGYGEPDALETKLTEVSKLLEAYARAIWSSNNDNHRTVKGGILNSEF
jgi:four helix bundle protein